MIDHVMRSRDGMKIHVVELFDPLGIEYCTFWFYSVVEKARHLFITFGRDLVVPSCVDNRRYDFREHASHALVRLTLLSSALTYSTSE
jgi:hypothetical protein